MTLTRTELANLEPGQVSAWLRGIGAARVEVDEPWAMGFVVFEFRRAPDGDPLRVGVPMHRTYDDYSLRVAECLKDLADAFDRSPESLLKEIQLADQDVLRLRAIGPTLTGGHVPVEVGSRLIQSARNLLRAAACSVVEPKPSFRGRPSGPVATFLERVKLTPPEPGSFVISAVTPVGIAAADRSLFEGVEEPFARRATSMLARALVRASSAARTAAIDGDFSGLTDSASEGVSANLCAALANFVDGETVTDLEASVRWSGSRPAPAGGMVRCSFSRESAEVLRDAAAHIRATSPREDFRVVGKVVRLATEDPGEGGIVQVLAEIDGQMRRVRIEMDVDDHQLAVESYSDREALLTCEGELLMSGSSARLDHVRDVRVVRVSPD